MAEAQAKIRESAEPRSSPADRSSSAERGSKGGFRRAEILTAEQRTGIAREAALKRWKK
jgi:hypothetical protein